MYMGIMFIVSCLDVFPSLDDAGCLTVHILSLINSYSILLAKAKVMEGSPGPHPQMSPDESSSEEVTVIFSHRCGRFLSLRVGHHVRIHPPWLVHRGDCDSVNEGGEGLEVLHHIFMFIIARILYTLRLCLVY